MISVTYKKFLLFLLAYGTISYLLIAQERYPEFYDYGNKEKIAIVRLSVRPENSFAEETFKVLKVYAKKWGYDIFNYEYLINETRLPYWNKVSALLKHLGDGRYNWLVWLDDDVVITDHKKPLTFFIENAGENKDFITTADALDTCLLDTGIMFFRNIEWSKRFLEETWETGPKIDRLIRSFHEQDTMKHLLLNNPDYASRTKIYQLPELQAILPAECRWHHINTNNGKDSKELYKWKPGVFCAQLVGWKSDGPRKKLALKLIKDLNLLAAS